VPGPESTARHPLIDRERACLAEALLAGGTPERAEQILTPLLAGPEDPTAAVEAWLLAALLVDRLGSTDRATDALDQAIGAARRNSVRRALLFAPGHRLSQLIRADRPDPEASGLLDELVGARSQGGPTTAVPPAAEPLTERELTILNHLPTMMTNAEIAAELFVSVNTIKAHLKRIFQKLDVGSRREAVRRARELGLLR
jgi:LuxR family maltose regulon positive regulatory protein